MRPAIRQLLLNSNPRPTFNAPLKLSTSLSLGQGIATFTRASSASVNAFWDSGDSSSSQQSLTILNDMPRFNGTRFISTGANIANPRGLCSLSGNSIACLSDSVKKVYTRTDGVWDLGG